MAEIQSDRLVPGSRVKVSFEALVVPGAFDEAYLRLDDGSIVRMFPNAMKIESTED